MRFQAVRVATNAAEQLAERRQCHHPERRLAVPDQADVDSELVAPGGELTRAVQRVDQPVFRPGTLGDPGGRFFLGNHRNARRCRAQAGGDQQLRLVVRLGDRGAVLLVQRFEAALAHSQNDRTSAAREVGGEGEEGGVIHLTCLDAPRARA